MCIRDRDLNFVLGQVMDGVCTVSYTHLDVYKRQLQCFNSLFQLFLYFICQSLEKNFPFPRNCVYIFNSAHKSELYTLKAKFLSHAYNNFCAHFYPLNVVQTLDTTYLKNITIL